MSFSAEGLVLSFGGVSWRFALGCKRAVFLIGEDDLAYVELLVHLLQRTLYTVEDFI